tara:strand:+ start:5190 stop:5306 length:117 start_codon:yes stop_codon:yes gene_type:complete
MAAYQQEYRNKNKANKAKYDKIYKDAKIIAAYNKSNKL